VHSNTIPHRVILIYFTLLFFCPYITFSQVEAQEKIDSLEKALKISKTTEQKIENLLALSELYEDNDLAKSISTVNQALKLSIDNKKQKSILLCKNQLVFLLIQKFELKKAEDLADETLILAEKLKSKENIASLYRAKSNICTYLAKYDEALKFSFLSLEKFYEINDFSGIFDIYNTIAEIFFNQNDINKSLKYILKAKEIANQKGNKRKEAVALTNIGMLYTMLNKNKEAIKNLKKAINLANSLGLKQIEGNSYLNLSKIYAVKNDHKSEFDCYNKAFNVFQSLNNQVSTTRIYLKYAFYYFNSNANLKKSMYYALLANKTSETLKNLNLQQESYEILYKIYEKNGEYKLALNYFQKYKEIADKINNQNFKSEIEIQEIKYQYNQEKRIEKLKHRKNIFLKSIYIFFILLSGTGLLLLTFKSSKNISSLFNQMKKSKKDLIIENSEMLTQHLKHKQLQDILSGISEKIGSLSFKNENEIIQINQILENLEMLKTGGTEIKKDEIFEDLHGEYCKKLRLKHHELTENEIKLCVYLKLNLSTKEISDITGNSGNNIIVARYRIRKKLGLNNTKINTVTYLSKI